MDGCQRGRQHFFGSEEMGEIRSRVILASITSTVGVNRREIGNESLIENVDG